MRAAADLHLQAVTEINAGRFRAARRLLDRARERADDEDLLGAVEGSLAYVEAEAGNHAVALALCDRALERPGLSRTTEGSIHSQRAMLLMFGGRSAEAMVELDIAIAMLPDSPKFLGRAYGNRGNLHLERNDLLRAESDFTVAVELLQRADLPVEAAMDEHNLGYTRMLAGDLVGALRDMDAAREVLAPLSAVAQAVGDQDRAEVLMAAGLVDEGREALAATARAYASRRLRRRQADAELTLARTLLVDDPAQALAVARRAARHFRDSGADAWRARAEAVGLTAEVNLGRRSPSILARGRELARELESQGLHWGAVVVHLQVARVMMRRGDPTGAGAVVAGVRVDGRAPLGVRLLSRDVRAELAAMRGRRSVALGHLRHGISELHAWQSSFGSLDLQTMVAGQGTRLGVRGLALAVESPSAAVLFEWSERARMLASRVQPVRAPQSEDIAADLAELRALTQPVDGPVASSARRVDELRRRVRERAWQHRGSGEFDDPCSLAELQAGLGPDTALVAHVVTESRVVALVVTDRATSRHDLGERDPLAALLGGLLPDLDVAATDLPGAMAGFIRAELGQRLEALAGVLVAPVLGAVGDRRVVLTPSGVLSGIPWTLLPGLTGRPVTVAQSATSWLARTSTPVRSASAGFVAGPRVARAEDEVSAAAKEWPSARVLLGDAADASAVSELAGTVDVLHVAAHGRHSSENPMFSGLQLVDGPWFGYDIDQLQTVPDVVILSACEVGRSTVRAGEELIGMTAAWLHAGARCVIASAAAVNDQAAYDVLLVVHEELAAGADPAAALAVAVPAVSTGAAPVPLVCFS